jgi:hypothetical protein
VTALLLGAYGLLLSLGAPGVLAAAAWTDRVPAATVVLWQAITLAAVLSALGVVLAAPEELVRAAGSGRPVAVAALVGALAVAAVIIVRLLVSLGRVMYSSRARRERHRTLVDLLAGGGAAGDLAGGGAAHDPGGGGAAHDPGGGGAADDLRVLDGPVPLAYCVPGREPRVVLTGGALRVLDDAQVGAVLAHERAHLRHRHELVMESFTAFYRAVPRPLRRRTPLTAVHLLLEMVADDAARKRCGAGPLRTALERLTDAPPPDDAGPATMDGRGRRLARLAESHTRSVAGTAAVLAASAAILVLPTVILVLPWLDRAVGAWPL